MDRRAPLALLLLVGLVALAPLALASPPDPLWVGGVFDAADTDDVVITATSTDATPPGPVPGPVRTLLAPAGAVPPARTAVLRGSPLEIRQGRAPPAS